MEVSSSRRRHLLGIALLSLSAFTLLSLLPVDTLGGATLRAFPTGNVMGVLGRLFADGGTAALGAGVLFLPVLLGLAGATLFHWLEASQATRWSALLLGLVVLVPAMLALFTAGTGYEI